MPAAAHCDLSGRVCTRPRGLVILPLELMGARDACNGSEFVEGLRRNPREVWVAGRRVDDVTADPVFQRPVRSIAQLYDLQLNPSTAR